MDNIYLDHASATPVDTRVLEFARPYLEGTLGNPSSLHSAGLGAKSAIIDAREKIIKMINAESEKAVVFTGSATDANNLAIRGTAQRNIGKGRSV